MKYLFIILFVAMHASTDMLHGGEPTQNAFIELSDIVSAYYKTSIPQQLASAQEGDSKSQYILYCFISGANGDLTPLKALWGEHPASYWLDKAVKQYEDGAVYIEGLHQYYAGNVDEAIELWKTTKDERAYNALGLVYLNEIGNKEKAIKYFREYQERDRGRFHLLFIQYQDEPENRDAIENELEIELSKSGIFTRNSSDIDVGWLCHHIFSKTTTLKEAEQLLLKMVEQENPKATHELACLYLSGLLAVPNMSKGHALLKKAAIKLNVPESRYVLGCIIRSNNYLFVERLKAAYMLKLDAGTLGSWSAQCDLSSPPDEGLSLSQQDLSYFWTYKQRHNPQFVFYSKDSVPIEGFEHDYLNENFINECSLGAQDDT